LRPGRVRRGRGPERRRRLLPTEVRPPVARDEVAGRDDAARQPRPGGGRGAVRPGAGAPPRQGGSRWWQEDAHTPTVCRTRGWVNADLPPVDLLAGQTMVARFALKLDLEPDEYTASFAASEAVPSESNPLGWDQNVGGERYRELQHATVIAVTPRPDGVRRS